MRAGGGKFHERAGNGLHRYRGRLRRAEEVIVGEVLGAIVPLAMLIAISPIPIVAQILVLFTATPKANATAYLAGFVVGVGAALSVFLAVAQALDAATGGGERSAARSWVLIGFGVLLLAGALRRYAKRPRNGEAPEMPGWMARITTLTSLRSLGLGAGVGFLNPKNLVAVVPAAAAIGSSALDVAASVAAAAVFVAIAAAGVAMPLLVAVALGRRADPVLRRWKDWLTSNNDLVLAVLFLVLGLLVLVEGITSL